MRREFTVCDVCQDPARSVKTYEVTSDGRKAKTDRCAEHGKPFEDVLNAATPKQPARRGREAKPTETAGRPAKRPGSKWDQVVTLDDIEKTKAR